MSKRDGTTQLDNRKLIGLHLKHVDKYLKVGELEKARVEIAKALAIDPENEYVLAYRERFFEMHQQPKMEIPVLEEAVVTSGEQVEGQVEAGESITKAEDVIQEKAPEVDVTSYLDQAEELVQNEKFDQARSLIEKAFQLNPRDPRAPNVFTRLREARMAAQKRREKEEAKNQEVENKIRTFVERAQEYFLRGKLERALDEVGNALSVAPTNADVKQLAEKIERAVEERRSEREEERRRKEEEARHRIEQELRRKREEEERRRREEEERRRAEEEARRQAAIRKIREHFVKAKEFLANEKFQRALREIEGVYILDPENLEARELEETVRRTQEEKRKAEEEARRKAEEEEQRRKVERKIRGYVERAREYLLRGKLERALDEVSHALSIDPASTEVKRLGEEIERAIEGRRRNREEDSRRKEEEARRRVEAEGLRRQQEEERRQRQQEEQVRAAELVGRLARLQNMHGYLRRALGELTAVSELEPGNRHVTILEDALRTTLEKTEGEVASYEAELPPETLAERKVREAKRGRVEVESPLQAREQVQRPLPTRYALRRKRYQRKYLITGTVVLFLLGVAVLLNRQMSLFSERKSLLVMPLVVSSENPQDSYLGEALMAGIIADISVSPDLIVFNEGTAFALRQSSDAMSAAKRVHATNVLHGTLEKKGTRLALDVRLDDTFTGKPIWSKQLVASSFDFLGIRNSIYEGLLSALDIQKGGPEKLLDTKLSDDPEALDLYWRGLSQLFGPRDEDVGLALQSFDQALKRDSRFALALAGKAAASLAVYEREWKNDKAWIEQAKELSAQALRLNDQIASAHRTLGSVYHYERNFTMALQEIRRALELDPNDASAFRALSLLYGVNGDPERATEAIESALHLDPLNYQTYVVLGIVKHIGGHYQEASAAYEQAVAFEPGIAWELAELLDDALLSQASYRRVLSLYENYLHLHPTDYTVLYKLGRANQVGGQIQVAQPYFHQVVDVARSELRRNPKSARANIYIALALTRLGRYKEAQGFANRALDIAPKDPQVLYGMAYMFSMQKETGAGLQWLGKAVSTWYSYRGILDVDLFNIRDDPEFAQVLQGSR